MPCCPVLLSYVNDHTDVLFEQINDDDDDDHILLLRTKVPGSESSSANSLLGAKVPWSEKARERKFQGTKGPGSEGSKERIGHRVLELSLRGAN